MAAPSVNRPLAPGQHHCGVFAGVNSRLRHLAAGFLLLAVLPAPNTERADCGNLADRTRAAAARVLDAIRVYEKCIASVAEPGAHGAKKGEDCDAEIQALDTAHDDFLDAVDDAKPCQ